MDFESAVYFLTSTCPPFRLQRNNGRKSLQVDATSPNRYCAQFKLPGGKSTAVHSCPSRQLMQLQNRKNVQQLRIRQSRITAPHQRRLCPTLLWLRGDCISHRIIEDRRLTFHR